MDCVKRISTASTWRWPCLACLSLVELLRWPLILVIIW